ncbi:MAG: pseudouridine synthase [Chloroflexota bacterium]
MERLQKVLARAGLGSRRACEGLIRSGRVTVNGRLVTELGTRVTLARDAIAVDGKPLPAAPAPVYWMVNKPRGFVATVSDPFASRTALQLLPEGQPRLFPVGRLDEDSEGLLLLTNDGELALRLTHPRYALEKEYLVLVRGRPSDQALLSLREGLLLDGRLTAPAVVELLPGEPSLAWLLGGGGSMLESPRNAWLRFVIHEGRKRQIRRMCQAVGHPVQRLARVRMGSLGLGALAPGQARRLTAQEIAGLLDGKGAEVDGSVCSALMLEDDHSPHAASR